MKKLDSIRVCNLPLKYFVPLFIVLIAAMATNSLGSDVISLFAFLYLVAGLLFFTGGRIPFVGKYLGGSLLLPLFGGSALMYFNLVHEDLLGQIDGFLSSGFIDLVLGTVIVGAILSLDRDTLIKTSLRLMPSILGAQAVAIGFLFIASKVSGKSVIDAVYMIGLVNFCGGSSGGVVALPSLYSQLFGNSIASYAGKFIVLLNIANVVCILFAGILNSIGKKYPKLTGNGKLIAEDKADDKIGTVSEETVDNKRFSNGVYIGAGCIVSIMILVLARLMGTYMSFLNYIVWATILTMLIKILNADDAFIRTSVKKCQVFMIDMFLPLIIMAIGIMHVDLVDTISLFSPMNLFIITMGILGAILGSLIFAKIFKMYPIDSMIGIGCNCAALGLSGVITVLSATDRMELMPYSTIVNRIGGAIMLIIINITIVFFM